MKANTWLSLILAVALAIVSGKMVLANHAKSEEAQRAEAARAAQKAENAAIDNIMTRASVRSYLDKPVEDEKVTTLLKAGMAAPTAMDKRPWRFVVVTDKEQLKALAGANPHAAFAAKAPLVIVVCGDMNKAIEGPGRDYWIQDAAAATENILLAAHALGLGAVWTGNYPVADRCRAIAKVLELPDHVIPLATVVIGYPDKTVKAKDKWDEDNVSYDAYDE